MHQKNTPATPTTTGLTAADYVLPPLGNNPGRTEATTPGSFANTPDIGGPLSFSSPDTRGMPAPSTKTAWDFLPDGWITSTQSRDREGA
ncbi:MAG: hypothetical protein AAGK78_13130, partial [Planctomycetota bacterium]